ncbi:MAG: Pho80p cyclin [Ramalina farinacea]|uniref:Pho80p cyclin n=1 Tax=Ramalina farinacea TaxID=258253 RepID=A0AA43QPF7_9LECA|nr:Pho80p cyclin [Ramalina farinacea]
MLSMTKPPNAKASAKCAKLSRLALPDYAMISPPYQSCRKPHVTGRAFYGQDGRWYNRAGPDSLTVRESCYSDFVPYDYDDRNLLTRLLQSLKYARSFLVPVNRSTLANIPPRISTPLSNRTSKRGQGSSRGTVCDSDDIEMLASSPSPKVHGNTPSCSPSSFNASYRSNRILKSPHPYIKPPPPAAFPQQTASSSRIDNPQERPLSNNVASPPTITKDAGTQYTPSFHTSNPAFSSTTSNTPSALGKRRGTSPPAKSPPPEPALQPQSATISKQTPSTTTAAQPTNIPTTVAESSSSSTTTTTSTNDSTSSPKRARPARPAIKIMPADYSTCDTKDLVLLISAMLLELIRHNDDIPLQDGRLTRFHSRAPPGISMKDYLQRLTTHATLSPPILLSMVYYIDRLCALYPAFTISSLTVHRFLITSATVASKGLSDSFWTNNTYARVGGVSLKELALLELEFLWRVEWRIVPRPEVLVDYYRSLVERSEGYRIEGAGKEKKRERSESGGGVKRDREGDSSMSTSSDGGSSSEGPKVDGEGGKGAAPAAAAGGAPVAAS